MSDESEFARKLFAGPCDFIWGASAVDSLPPAKLPEVAFVGRSNAGKSSLINALTGRKTLARVSNTPGRTRQINFFDLGGKIVLADLPGYGYARASRSLSEEWQSLIFAYLRGRANLARVFVLIDARRGAMDTDREACRLLDQAAVSYVLALTKIDQLSPGERTEAERALGEEAGRHTAAYPEVFSTSALKGLGLDALKAHIAALAAN
ncbi:MAG TPA: ribosome biogenesis GTP-binding protein YihA/YsxC [Rhizomicrobium sp.]|nr:ribosome biogenesis GTP-binding protein YihA/YsxC [Rhizomicrobium sp.]